MRPHFAWRITGTAARDIRKAPLALTVIPNGARSSARDLVKPTIAAFEAA